MLLAVPSNAPGGLDAQIADHFGHCDVFTLVKIDQEIGEVTILQNEGHDQGGCMGPVMLLKDKGADALVSGGMGQRPLAGFQQVGITVYFKEDASTVREAAEMILAGKCREFGEQHVCGGHGGECGSHAHGHNANIEPVDGPVEKDRVVHMSYELLDTEGTLLDASEARYLHGYGQVAEGLEKALEGRVAGDSLEVTVSPMDGYGEKDASKVIEVPVEKLPEGLKAGETIHAQLPDGSTMPMTLMSIDGAKATLDANHPLAGKTLVFKVKVLEVLGERKASG